MQKAATALRSIGEVSRLLDLPTHVLRYWETQFPQLAPVKRADGRRYYRLDDLALAAGLSALLRDEGLTTRGVQKRIAADKGASVRALGLARLPERFRAGDEAPVEAAREEDEEVQPLPAHPAVEPIAAAPAVIAEAHDAAPIPARPTVEPTAAAAEVFEDTAVAEAQSAAPFHPATLMDDGPALADTARTESHVPDTQKAAAPTGDVSAVADNTARGQTNAADKRQPAAATDAQPRRTPRQGPPLPLFPALATLPGSHLPRLHALAQRLRHHSPRRAEPLARQGAELAALLARLR